MSGEPYINIADRAIGIIDDGKPCDIVTPFSNSGSFVNRLRNPGVDIWQRGSTFNIAANAAQYTADGWIVIRNTAGADATLHINRGDSLGRSSGSLSLTASGGLQGNMYSVMQRIESSIAAEFAGKRITLQFKIISSGTSMCTFETRVPTIVDNWAGTFTIDVPPTNFGIFHGADHVTTVAFTFDVAPNAIRGYAFIISNLQNLAAAADWVALSEFDLRETPGWPLGPCHHPPPPELRPLPFELLLCQRYYEKTYNLNVAPGAVQAAGAILIHMSGLSSGGSSQMFRYVTNKRATPTLTIFSMNGEPGVVNDFSSDTHVVPSVFTLTAIGAGVWIMQVVPSGNLNFQFQWVVSAEL